VYDAYILGSLLSTPVTFTFNGTAIPLLFHTTRKTFITLLDELFYALLPEVCSFLSATWSQLFPGCSPLSKYVAAKILHGNEFPIHNHDEWRILSYKLIHHIQ